MLEIAPIQPRLIRNRLFNVSMRKALPSDRLVSLFFAGHFYADRRLQKSRTV